MDDVVGNLGEPLDFNEHRMDDEDDGTNVDMDPQDIDAVGTSKAASFGDIEVAGSSGSGSNSIDADVLAINSLELEEVCVFGALALGGQFTHILG